MQEQAYEAIRGGSDVLVIAPTAGGKSEAALIPVLDTMLKSGTKGVACIYLSPLKALINDQEERIASFCRPIGLSLSKWHGDVPKGDRGWNPDDAPQFLLITPESLEVILHEKRHVAALANVQYVIVDELHAFVESERGVQLRILLDRLDQITKSPVQRIGLSATVGNPDEVLSWFSGGRRSRHLVAIPSPAAEKKFLFVIEPDPDLRINALAGLVSGKKALVFVNSRTMAETILQEATGRIKNLHIHHSSVAPSKKKEAEEAFHSSEGACIICTNTLELGVDIGDLDIVVQVGPPDSVSSFLQRMGRSGRRDQAAFVAWFLSDPGELLSCCAVIECAKEKKTEPLKPLEKPWNVLVQQIFLTVFSASRIGRGVLVRKLLSFYVFSQLLVDDIEYVLGFLVSEGYLSIDGEIVMLGPISEKVFGRSNYRDLYSVIKGGDEYRAITPEGDIIGTLDARFAHRSDPVDFALGGTTWSVVKCDERHNLVVVVPGGNVKNKCRVFRSSGGESALSLVICNTVQRIIARGETVLPLGPSDTETLRQAIGSFPTGIQERGIFIRAERGNAGREVVVYSFFGRQFNRVLALLLKGHLCRVQVRYDDQRVRVTRAGKTGAAERVAEGIRAIPAFSPDEIISYLPLPSPDLWKFATMLPLPLFREMVFADYFHTNDVIRILAHVPVTILPDEAPDAPANAEE